MNFKQAILGIFTTILGFFVLIFTLVVGAFAFLGAIIAAPFLKKKLREQQEKFQQSQQQEQEINHFYESDAERGSTHQGKTLDGDYQDITDKK